MFRLVLLIALLGVGGCSGDNSDRSPEQSGPLVNCHDEARDEVARTFVNQCRGRIVSDDEAARIGWAPRARPRSPSSRHSRRSSGSRKIVATGTGFFVTEEGHVLTSLHVLENCWRVSVSPAIGGTHFASVLTTDRARDLAVVQVPFVPRGVARFAPNVGRTAKKEATVMGYPDRRVAPDKPSIAGARILGVKSVGPELKVVGFRGKVKPGNSGGPLIDRFGRVVGVVFAKAVARDETRPIDLGFAIPVDDVMDFLDGGGIEYTTDSTPLDTPPDNVAATANSFIARVGCWR